jgi:hypothetical protein
VGTTHAHDSAYLFKIGYADIAAFRADTLNGRARRRGIDTSPCLGFSDWRVVPCMDFRLLARARQVEGQIKRGLYHAFERFDPKALIGERPPCNGESEIYRVRQDQLENAVAHAGSAITNRFVAPKVQIVMAAVIAEILR